MLKVSGFIFIILWFSWNLSCILLLRAMLHKRLLRSICNNHLWSGICFRWHRAWMHRLVEKVCGGLSDCKSFEELAVFNIQWYIVDPMYWWFRYFILFHMNIFQSLFLELFNLTMTLSLTVPILFIKHL